MRASTVTFCSPQCTAVQDNRLDLRGALQICEHVWNLITISSSSLGPIGSNHSLRSRFAIQTAPEDSRNLVFQLRVQPNGLDYGCGPLFPNSRMSSCSASEARKLTRGGVCRKTEQGFPRGIIGYDVGLVVGNQHV